MSITWSLEFQWPISWVIVKKLSSWCSWYLLGTDRHLCWASNWDLPRSSNNPPAPAAAHDGLSRVMDYVCHNPNDVWLYMIVSSTKEMWMIGWQLKKSYLIRFSDLGSAIFGYWIGHMKCPGKYQGNRRRAETPIRPDKKASQSARALHVRFPWLHSPSDFLDQNPMESPTYLLNLSKISWKIRWISHVFRCFQMFSDVQTIWRHRWHRLLQWIRVVVRANGFSCNRDPNQIWYHSVHMKIYGI